MPLSTRYFLVKNHHIICESKPRPMIIIMWSLIFNLEYKQRAYEVCEGKVAKWVNIIILFLQLFYISKNHYWNTCEKECETYWTWLHKQWTNNTWHGEQSFEQVTDLLKAHLSIMPCVINRKDLISSNCLIRVSINRHKWNKKERYEKLNTLISNSHFSHISCLRKNLVGLGGKHTG